MEVDGLSGHHKRVTDVKFVSSGSGVTTSKTDHKRGVWAGTKYISLRLQFRLSEVQRLLHSKHWSVESNTYSVVTHKPL
jgi:hypothetical protein